MINTASAASRYLLESLSYVIPENIELEPFRDKNLNTWRAKGAHSLDSCSGNRIILSVNQREYAATLFAEAQHLLNHACEHRGHLLRLTESNLGDTSPSWAFVSLYYFALYIALAWTRIANGAVLYLDKPALLEYGGSKTKMPPGGAYQAKFSINSSTKSPKLLLEKCSASHFHEAVWIATSNEAAKAAVWVRALSAARRPTAEEQLSLRALGLLNGLTFSEPLTWQSKLRNAINYRPGYSYRSVVNNNFLRFHSVLGKPAFASLDAAVVYGEKAKFTLSGKKSPTEVPNEAVNLIISQTLVLEMYAEEALERIAAIRDSKCSARLLRKKFLKKYCQQPTILSPISLT